MFAWIQNIQSDLKTIIAQGKKIMATQADAVAQLQAVNSKLNKIAVEENNLQAAIADLKAQLANAPISPELQAAVDAVSASAQVLDDIVPDPVAPTA